MILLVEFRCSHPLKHDLVAERRRLLRGQFRMLRKLTQLAHRSAHGRFVERIDGCGTELAVSDTWERQIELSPELLGRDFCNEALVTSFSIG